MTVVMYLALNQSNEFHGCAYIYILPTKFSRVETKAGSQPIDVKMFRMIFETRTLGI